MSRLKAPTWRFIVRSMKTKMTPEEYRAALEALGFNHIQAAAELGISRRSSVRYATGDGAPKYIALALEALMARQDLAEAA